MADQAHLAALRHGADAWNKWRAGKPNLRPDLSGATLRGLDLAKAELAGADLRKADLRGTILRGVDFDGADLGGANLVGALFLNCAQLVSARNWQSAFRDPDLACGADLPPIPGRS